VESVSTARATEALIGRIPATRSQFFGIETTKPIDKPIQAWSGFVGTPIHHQPRPSFRLVVITTSKTPSQAACLQHTQEVSALSPYVSVDPGALHTSSRLNRRPQNTARTFRHNFRYASLNCRSCVLNGQWNQFASFDIDAVQTPPPQPNIRYTTSPSTASQPSALTAYPPFPKDPKTPPNVRSFLIIAAFATAKPPDTVMHLTTSASLRLMVEEYGSNKTARVTRISKLNMELDRRAGRASRAALRRMFGICSVAIGLRRLGAGSVLVASLAADVGAISGDERCSWMRKSETAKGMGRICPSKMYVRILAVSYRRALAIYKLVYPDLCDL
jgi:hypothetical protein